jgi:hypothetical protein
MTLLTAWLGLEEAELRGRLRTLRALVRVLGSGALPTSRPPWRGRMRTLPFGRVTRVRHSDLHELLLNPTTPIVFLNGWEVVAEEPSYDRCHDRYLRTIAFEIPLGGVGRFLAEQDIAAFINGDIVVVAACETDEDCWELDDWVSNINSGASA